MKYVRIEVHEISKLIYLALYIIDRYTTKHTADFARPISFVHIASFCIVCKTVL